MQRTHTLNLSKHFRNSLYTKTSWERGDEDFILIKVGGAKMHNAMLPDYRACQVFLLRYDCLRHAQQIMKYALSKGPQDWNNRSVDQLEVEADWNWSK